MSELNNIGNAIATISDMTIYATGGTTSYGLYNESSSSSAFIRNGTIIGSTNSLKVGTGFGQNETHVYGASLEGSVSGFPTCWDTTYTNGTNLDNNCQTPL